VLALRTAFLLAITPAHAPLAGDEPVYDAVARSMLAGQGFTYRHEPWIWKPPGWPIVLGSIYATVGDARHTVVLFQGLFDACTICLTGMLAAWVFGSRLAGALAFLLAAVWPPFLRESRVMQTEPLYTLGLTVIAFAFSRFWRSPGVGRAFVVGLVTGATAMVRPTGLIPMAGAVLGWAWLERARTMRRLPSLAAMALGVALVVAPWTARNARVFHAFVPLSTGGGELFYMGTTPETEGRWVPREWLTLKWPLLGEEELRLGRKLNALERDRVLLRAGLRNWSRAPGRSLLIAVKRIWRLVFLPVGEGDRPWLRWAFFAVLVVLYALAWPRGVEGLRSRDRRLRFAGILLVALLFSVLAQSAFYTNSRYFEPMRPLVLILAAGTLARWLSRRAPALPAALGEAPAPGGARAPLP
jgi:hypothetical protein